MDHCEECVCDTCDNKGCNKDSCDICIKDKDLAKPYLYNCSYYLDWSKRIFHPPQVIDLVEEYAKDWLKGNKNIKRELELYNIYKGSWDMTREEH